MLNHYNLIININIRDVFQHLDCLTSNSESNISKQLLV